MQQQITQCGDDKEKIKELEHRTKERVAEVMPVYHTVAIQFADLHDTPERMLEKNCINRIVPWRESRKWFHWRLRRLLLEQELVKQIIDAARGTLTLPEAKERLRRWFIEDRGETVSHIWDNDNNETVVDWLEQQNQTDSAVLKNIAAVKRDTIVQKIQDSIEECPESALGAVTGLCQKLSITQRNEIVRILSQLEDYESAEEPREVIE